MRRSILAALAAAGLSAGCGDGVPKPKELTPEDLQKIKDAEKTVADEERGPAQPKGKGKRA